MNEGHIYVATTCSLVPRPHPMVLSRSHDMREVSFWNETAVWDLDHGQRSTHVMSKKGIPLGYKISGSAVHSHSL